MDCSSLLLVSYTILFTSSYLLLPWKYVIIPPEKITLEGECSEDL